MWFFFAFSARECRVSLLPLGPQKRADLVDLSTVCCGMIGGLIIFKDNFEQQQINASSFIPT